MRALRVRLHGTGAMGSGGLTAGRTTKAAAAQLDDDPGRRGSVKTAPPVGVDDDERRR
jgi:hypothetical protein